MSLLSRFFGGSSGEKHEVVVVQRAEQQLVEFDVTDLTDGEAFALAQLISANAHEVVPGHGEEESEASVFTEMRAGRRIFTVRCKKDAVLIPMISIAKLAPEGKKWDDEYKANEAELVKAEPFATEEEILTDAGLPLSWGKRHETPKDPDAEAEEGK